jgi:hypothetical protein
MRTLNGSRRLTDLRSASVTWGTTASERSLSFPCDALVRSPDATLYRGVTIEASPRLIFRWLCQLRMAPYSYDWIDNLGRRSPGCLIAGLDELEPGQGFMRIFELVAYELDRHLTLRMKPHTAAYAWFGDVAGTYLVVPVKRCQCRVLVKLLVRYPGTAVGWFMRHVLPWGDLVMMRRQLLNLKQLIETTPAAKD